MAKAEIYIGDSYESAFQKMKEQRNSITELAGFLKQTNEGVAGLTATNNLNNVVHGFVERTIGVLESMVDPIDSIIHQTDLMLQSRLEVAESADGILDGIE